MTSVEFDFSELNEFAVSIEGAAAGTGRNVEKALAVAAGKGKKAWIREAKRKNKRTLRAFPYSIDYDEISVKDGGILETEVGPNLDRNQGALGVVEDAPGGVAGSPQRNYEKAAQEIAADLVVGIAKAVDDGMGAL